MNGSDNVELASESSNHVEEVLLLAVSAERDSASTVLRCLDLLGLQEVIQVDSSADDETSYDEEEELSGEDVVVPVVHGIKPLERLVELSVVTCWLNLNIDDRSLHLAKSIIRLGPDILNIIVNSFGSVHNNA